MTVSLFQFVGWKMKGDESGSRHGKLKRKMIRCVVSENNTHDSDE